MAILKRLDDCGLNKNVIRKTSSNLSEDVIKSWYIKGKDEAPSELFDLVNAFIYLQDPNHYPEYVKPIIYGYLGSKMLEG